MSNSNLSPSTPASSLPARSLKSIWHPCTQMKHHETLPLVPIVRGEGVWLYGPDGERYLDAIGSWWVNLFGHANPRIGAAIHDQLDRLEHVMLAGFTHEPVVRLSERLIGLVPGGLGHCFYSSDGASAIEIALKMSFHYWRNSGRPEKSGFVSLQNDYHGETLGALSVTDVALFKQTYAPLLRPSVHVPTPDWRCAEEGITPEAHARRAAAALEAHLAGHHAETAALIVEPLVQGAAGMGMYHPSYLSLARQICDRYDVHLIADEIAVGFGRTGTLFACEQADIAPDFLCLGKGLSGGYLPLSVTLTSDQVYQAFYRDETAQGFLHSHTHTGNILACRAALATLDILEQDKVIDANRARARYLNDAAKPIAAHPLVKNFRNCGMIWAFEVDAGDPGFADRFFQAAMAQGLVLRPLERTVYFMPPYVIGEGEMEQLVAGTLKALDSFG
ncbi:adenosylmethionine--8-amino-7-oxononanoate transaminase [Nitrosovibrio sp. Nv17]|uniref:adenosylmethionine--8-amino-7-oxononanoate transaminase n=1 Tax=Nitrosovibrio sp. Nv17 TaxID=1855339 RepID=UPI0009085D60|nr:adenosylmethionine--8-amino-7-oxononanoate transaminase [Nitrosovibrio sp. Nv17]SFW39368.1 adenosylmethionine-8-amino-7-oxononanoate aminotransferase [Nitrosovibrio sp. Nv17]